jgi:parallel beta-helix repeat protein
MLKILFIFTSILFLIFTYISLLTGQQVIEKSNNMVYWVEQKNLIASDDNPGTEKQPFKTISKASSIMQPGDTVIVRSGIYRESIICSHGGTGIDHMITYKAYPGEEVIVKGSDIVTDWKKDNGDIWKKSEWDINSQQVFTDGVSLQQIGKPCNDWPEDWLKSIGKEQEDMKPGTFYYNASFHTLYAWLNDGSEPNKHLMEVSVRPFLFTTNKHNYIHLSGFTFMHTSAPEKLDSRLAAVSIDGYGHLIENNCVLWCSFGGLGGAPEGNAVIRNNICNYNGCYGMDFHGKNWQMIDNETSYNNYRHFNTDWHAGGVKNISPKDVLVIGHKAYNNYGQGIWFDINCQNVRIENCIVAGNSGHGIHYEISSSGTIINNIVFKNGKEGIYISLSNDCLVANNLVFDSFRGIVVGGNPKRGDLMNNEVRNNIVMNCKDALIAIAYDRGIPYTFHNNTSDYNLFWETEEKLPFRHGWSEDRHVYGLKRFQELSKNEQHSIVANPKFLNTPYLNFNLSPDSPAIDVGIEIKTVKKDFFGNSRPYGNGYDIGPVEFIMKGRTDK